MGLDLYLLVHFTGECKRIKEFFPTINEPVYKKSRKQMTDDFPSQEYTDPRCMRLIKQGDKDANAGYVKEFHDELRKNIKNEKKKIIKFHLEFIWFQFQSISR